jgi:hypothetical protein
MDGAEGRGNRPCTLDLSVIGQTVEHLGRGRRRSYRHDSSSANRKHFFFERTVLDECVSIDIVEKYKTTALGGHKQETKKRTQQIRPVGLGRQHWLPLTILTGQLD